MGARATAGLAPATSTAVSLAQDLLGGSSNGETPAPRMSDRSLTLPAAPTAQRLSLAAFKPGTGWLGVVSVAGMIAAWWLFAASGLVSRDMVPSPGDVWAAGAEILHDGYRGTTLWENIFATFGRMAAGFLLATVIGVSLGLWMGRVRAVAASLDWIIQFMRPLPPLSYMILLILWLGTGDGSKTALLFLTAFPIIVAASAAGVAGVSQLRVQVAQTLGASQAQVLRHVVLPSAMPMVFTGLQVALAAAFSTVVSAELMAATNGLGWMVISASTFLRNDVIILCILILGLMGVTLAWSLRQLDKRLVHWRGRL